MPFRKISPAVTCKIKRIKRAHGEKSSSTAVIRVSQEVRRHAGAATVRDAVGVCCWGVCRESDVASGIRKENVQEDLLALNCSPYGQALKDAGSVFMACWASSGPPRENGGLELFQKSHLDLYFTVTGEAMQVGEVTQVEKTRQQGEGEDCEGSRKKGSIGGYLHLH